MPPPDEPVPFGLARRLSPRTIDEMDPDYRYFLTHVRLCGNAYEFVIPSKDGVSAPKIIRYDEEPLPGHNAGAAVANSKGGGKGGPSPVVEDRNPMEEDSSAARNKASRRRLRRGVAPAPAAGVKRSRAPDGEARSGAVPARKASRRPALDRAWLDSQADVDDDYRLLLQGVYLENGNGKAVYRAGGTSFVLGDTTSSVENSGGDEEEEDSYEVEDQEAEEDGNDAEEREEGEEGEGILESGDDGAGTEEGNSGWEETTAGSALPIVNVFELEEISQQDEEDEKEEQEHEEEEEEEEVVKKEEQEHEEEEEDEMDEDPITLPEEGAVKKEEDDGLVNEKDVGAGSDLQMVHDLEFEVGEGEQQLNAPVMVTTKGSTLKRAAGPSVVRSAMPHNASELQGAIWPQHIIERPYSEFKEKLIEDLIKPFDQEEYDSLLAMATNRAPVIKHRRTRQNVVSYPWKHEMGKSYFDNYPELAEQFELESNSYPNRLALLRGFFFWLKHVGSYDQFRPWSDDFKRYRVIPFEVEDLPK